MTEVLDRIMAVSLNNYNPDLYHSELVSGSQMIDVLNQRFRLIAPRLDIVSLYETEDASLRPTNEAVRDHETLINHFRKS